MNTRVRKKNFNSGSIFDHLSDVQIALFIFTILAAIYSLTYSGTFSSDDEHILASRSISYAFDAQVSDLRVFGNSRVYSYIRLPGEQSIPALNIEPVQMLLSSCLVRLAVFFNVGQVQSVFLLNIWATALAAIAIYFAVRFQGNSKLAAFLASILFGLASMAWPCSRTFFRDLLAMTFLAIAWMCEKRILSKEYSVDSKGIKTITWAGMFISLLAGILTKNTVLIVVPVLIVELLIHKVREFSSKQSRREARSIFTRTLLIVLAATLGFVLIWILLSRLEAFARFSPEYYFSVLKYTLNSAHPNFLSAFFGPLVSPGKSMFLFSPILILAIVALIKNWKRTWSAWAYALLLILAQALFYDGGWWGNIYWGLRFTLPAIALLVVASGQAIEDWLKSGRGRFALFCIGMLSFCIQLVGVLPSAANYYRQIAGLDPIIFSKAIVWDPKYSAVIGNLKSLLSGGSTILAVLRNGIASLPIFIGAMLILTLVYAGFTKIKQKWFAVIPLVFCVAMTCALPFAYKNDPAYFPERTDLEAVQEVIEDNKTEGDITIIKSYGTPAWYYLMNWAKPGVAWASLPFVYPKPELLEQYAIDKDPSLVIDEISKYLLSDIASGYQRIWLVIPDDSPGAELDIEIRWLMQDHIFIEEWNFQYNDQKTRLFLFSNDP